MSLRVNQKKALFFLGQVEGNKWDREKWVQTPYSIAAITGSTPYVASGKMILSYDYNGELLKTFEAEKVVFVYHKFITIVLKRSKFGGTLNSATLGLGGLMLMLPSRSFFTVKEDPGKVHGDPGNFAQFSFISFLAAYPGIFVPG